MYTRNYYTQTACARQRQTHRRTDRHIDRRRDINGHNYLISPTKSKRLKQ